MNQPNDRTAPRSIKNIPTLKYYQRTYAVACEENDQKAVVAFKEFESREKLGRLRNELMWVKNDYVSDKVCGEIIGHRRRGKYQSYSKWASIMLQLLAKK